MNSMEQSFFLQATGPGLRPFGRTHMDPKFTFLYVTCTQPKPDFILFQPE
jgi:hypothetical protein